MIISIAVIAAFLFTAITSGNLPGIVNGSEDSQTNNEVTVTTTTNPTTTAPATTSPVPTPKKVAPTPKKTPASKTPTTTKERVDLTLTSDNIVHYTNEARKEAGVAALKINRKLEAMAKAKVKDMIARDYFEHVSPTGEDVVDLSRAFDYRYQTLGENIAMGDFRTSRGVVNGWMESPGHRENILLPAFTEIGVYAEYGLIEGRRQWVAAQIFGKPGS